MLKGVKGKGNRESPGRRREEVALVITHHVSQPLTGQKPFQAVRRFQYATPRVSYRLFLIAVSRA